MTATNMCSNFGGFRCSPQSHLDSKMAERDVFQMKLVSFFSRSYNVRHAPSTVWYETTIIVYHS